MKTTKLTIMAATLLLGGMVLTGCSSPETMKSNTKSNEVTKKVGKYPLIATDTESSISDMNTSSRMVIKYLDHKNKKQTIKLAVDDEGELKGGGIVYSEHILNDDQAQPYLVIKKSGDDTKITVYRQPYVSYVQNELAGKVVDKSTNK